MLAPPRTASTALARILWNHTKVGWYSHEPFEPTYYRDAPAEHAFDLLDSPAPIAELNPSRAGGPSGTYLVVKEMTFQVGDAFPLLAALATRPIVVLIRDPRLTVASRMKVLRRSRRPEVFPLRESGWEDLARQLAYLRERGIPHVVVDSGDLRRAPETAAPALLATLGLEFTPELLRWRASEATVSILNVAVLRAGLVPGSEGEQDLGQTRMGIEAVRALLPLVEQALGAEQARPIRDALSQLQMAYVQAAGSSGADAGERPATPESPREDPGESPGPAQRSGRLWVPGQ